MGVRRAIRLISLICVPLLLQCSLVYGEKSAANDSSTPRQQVTPAARPPPPQPSAYLPIGTQFTLSDVNPPQMFEIVSSLGQGGIKRAYRVRRIQPPCTSSCDFVISEYRTNSTPFLASDEVTHSFRVNGASPHVRREYARRTASIGKHPLTVSLAEFAESTLGSVGFGESSGLMALDILGEQSYQALQEFERRGIVNSDIKPENILVSSSVGRVTPECFVSGDCHFVIADLDLIEPRTHRSTPRGTPNFLPPEILSIADFKQRTFRGGKTVRYDTKLDLWSVSMTLWDQYSRHYLSPVDAAISGDLRRELFEHRFDELEDIHAEITRMVRTQMNSHASKLTREGRSQEADAVRRLRRRILNGFAWNPDERILNLQIEPQNATNDEARTARERRVQERVAARRESWPGLHPTATVDCHRVELGDMILEMLRSRKP